MESRNVWFWTIVALLLAVAIGFGVLLTRKNMPDQGPRGQGPSQPPAPTSTLKTISEEDRKAVLDTPRNTATTEEREAHFEIVRRLSVYADTIDISNCSPQPLVAQHRVIRDIVFTNKDDVEHEIQLDPQHLYKVPPHGSVSVDPNFGRGMGLYGYGCDNSLGAVGILFIVP